MSKIFEAIQRLERESGKVLPGVSAAGRQVLQEVGPPAEVAEKEKHPEPETPEVAPEVAPAGVDGHVPAEVPAVPPFSLKDVPAESARIMPASRIVYYTDPDSAGADRFRLLRMHLWPLWEAGKLKTLFVTSAASQDGKSTIVLNLATALAERGERSVLVIEGDLSHPAIAERVGLEKRAGLAECIDAGENPLSLLTRVDPLGWYLLRAGRCEGNPTEILQSPALADVFSALRPLFDWIIIDTPPVMPLTDTLSLRQYADAGLMIVRADQTPREAVDSAIELVGSKNLLGMILNGSEEYERLYSDYRNSYRAEKRKR